MGMVRRTASQEQLGATKIDDDVQAVIALKDLDESQRLDLKSGVVGYLGKLSAPQFDAQQEHLGVLYSKASLKLEKYPFTAEEVDFFRDALMEAMEQRGQADRIAIAERDLNRQKRIAFNIHGPVETAQV